MTTTIDKAGRVVIPAPIRDKHGLAAGTELEIHADEMGIHLRRSVAGPEIAEEGGLRFARPRVPADRLPPVDLERLIDEERQRWP
jgi:AbrB family looped-hinge helix DNA binding protein